MMTLNDYISMHPNHPLKVWAEKFECNPKFLANVLDGKVVPNEKMRLQFAEKTLGAVPPESWGGAYTLRAYCARFPEITQEEWAKKFGVSRPYVSQLMHGKRKPSRILKLRIELVTKGAVSAGSWGEVEQ